MKMDYIEISAKTVDDAITEAIIKLGTTHDKIEYEVIEKGSAGFLGINRKDAVIRARRKNDTNDNIRDFLLLLILFTIRGAYRHRSTRWHLSIYTAHQDQAQLRCLRFRPPGTRFQSA